MRVLVIFFVLRRITWRVAFQVLNAPTVLSLALPGPSLARSIPQSTTLQRQSVFFADRLKHGKLP